MTLILNTKLMLYVLAGLMLGFVAGGFAQKSKPTLEIEPNLGQYRLDASRLQGLTAKRINLIRLKYNGASLPCVVMDASDGELSRAALPPSISCGWTPQIIEMIDKE